MQSVYQLFKKANLRWRLFKQQGRSTETSFLRYKRPIGTRWTEHQAVSLHSCNANLPLLIAYLNNQIADPYNNTMKKVAPKLQGILGNVNKTSHILFNAIKEDILAGITPMTKVLQDTYMDKSHPAWLDNTLFLRTEDGKEAGKTSAR